MEQIASVLGALMILVAYGAVTLGLIDSARPLYGVLNLAGSGLLAWVAIVDRRAGFILLETAWALISLVSLARWMRGRRLP